ncbi:MAG: hypothetical protein EA382_08930, partial [Spirochaetaceae bacterium]
IDLCRAVRDGAHPGIAAGARVDLFGYSIGCLLVQMLMMADPDGLFGSSRAVLFCGGSILEHARPVSKAIVDEEAHRGLTYYLGRVARGGGVPVGRARGDLRRGRMALRRQAVHVARVCGLSPR